MKIINKIKEVYKSFLYRFVEKDERFNSFSTLEQSKFIANKIIFIISMSSGLGLLILIFAKTDQIIITKGELQPTNRVREIKIPIAGVVDQILIKEGDYVLKDQKLLKLDDSLAKETQINLKKQIDLKNNELNLKNIEKDHSLKIIKNQIKNLSNIIPIEEKNLKRFDSLIKQGAISIYEYDQQKIKILNLNEELNSKKSLKQVKEFQIMQEIKSIENNIIDFQNQLENINEKLKYSFIISPINGYIFELRAKDTGYVINPNLELMQIVPDNDLEASIFINSNDIGFINIGKKAEISVDSYPASDFGVLNGSVRFISQNSSKIKENTDNLFFSSKIKLDTQYLNSVKGKKLELKPGMSITANIKLRRLSYLQIIFNLFTDKAKSIKEI